ncbi:MAG: hypothetical protein OHK0015_19270 [Chloroflexi bacterium OHK40]
MGKVWQLQEAKNRLSEVIDEALRDGPQVITRRGAETAVVLSYAAYRELRARRQPLSAFLRESPLAYTALDLERDTSPPRGDPEL